SEVGVYDYRAEEVLAKGRLKPGEMIAADTATGRLLLPGDVDDDLKRRQPYKRWLKEHTRYLESRLEGGEPAVPPMKPDELQVYQKLFGVSFEERDQVLRPLCEAGQEAVGSMGDDTPI